MFGCSKEDMILTELQYMLSSMVSGPNETLEKHVNFTTLFLSFQVLGLLEDLGAKLGYQEQCVNQNKKKKHKGPRKFK